jgi:hypothetical protein
LGCPITFTPNSNPPPALRTVQSCGKPLAICRPSKRAKGWSPNTSDLIQDLNSVPNIIGGLGLSIASAQKALDANFLDGVQRILAMAHSVVGPATGNEEALAFLKDMLLKLAPSRYQFTETTLTVRLDLAQSLKFSGTVGLGFGLGAININAAFTLGYAYDYRAAAQCQTVLHAYAMDANTFTALLSRAGAINDKSLELPPRTQVEQAILDKNSEILQKLTGKDPLPIKTKPAITKLDPAGGTANTARVVTVTAAGFQANSIVDVYDNATPPAKVGAASNLPLTNQKKTTFDVNIPGVAAGVYQLQVVNTFPSGNSVSDFTDECKFTVK